MKGSSFRWIIWLSATAGAATCCWLWAGIDGLQAEPEKKVLLFIALGSLCPLLVFAFPFADDRCLRLGSIQVSATTLLFIGLSAALRLMLLGADPSDDLYRYLWEGKLIRAGESPYATVANDPLWSHLRDGYWQLMNHKDALTVYPPLAQFVFSAAGWIAYDPWPLKLLLIIVDLGIVLLLLGGLGREKLPLRFAGFYAFNPVSIFGVAAEGHFDPLFVAPLLVSVMFARSGRSALAWLALGIAIQFKLLAIFLIPLYWLRIERRSCWFLPLAAGLPLLPFGSDVVNIVHGMRHFGSEMAFNGSLHALIRWLTESREFANGAILIGFGLCLLFALVKRSNVYAYSFWAFAALIVWSPTVHYWYLLWALPFLCFRPSGAWLLLSASMGLYFFVWRNAVEQGWGLSDGQQIAIWAPFLLFGAYELRNAWGWRSKTDGEEGSESVSVVIPTLNAAEHLPRCFEALQSSSITADEVIVADCGSSDDTLAIARDARARIVSAERGRGAQIGKGVEAAKGDIILALHADAILHPRALESMRDYLQRNPQAQGGALGQRFSHTTAFTTGIEILNEARATLRGTSFGDQGQFFRRSAALGENGFPNQPLMEDVEWSARLMSQGETPYLGLECVVDASKWRSPWRRFWLVLNILTQYRLIRVFRFGKTSDFTERLYAEYYR